MLAVTQGKLLAACCCLMGLLACWLMWDEAGLPPQDRPLRLFGASGGKGISSEVYPESSIAFMGGACMLTLLGIVGLIGRDDTSSEWHWGPAFVGVGVLLMIFLHQARRVNGTDMDVIQLGHVLGLLAGAGLIASGVFLFVVACRTAGRTRRCNRSEQP